MAKHEILESFRWLPPDDMRVKKGAGKKVIIKGRALFAGTVSRNLRKYVKEELVRAARTLVGRPVTINHDPHRIVGHVIDAEEEENAIEYVAEINKHPYVQRLLDRKSMATESYYKKWMVNPISGVSVEADYRHNRCIECGESFYDQATFEAHMWEAHRIKNFKFEPRGILMKALSLVEPPEKPGVSGTTIELMETAQGMSQLMETLTTEIKNEMEYKQKMKEVAVVTPQKRIAVGRTKPKKPKIKEQDEEIKPGSHYCEEHPDDPRCKEHKKAIHGEAKEQEPTQQEVPPEQTVKPPTPCPEGFEDDGLGGCKPKDWPAVSQPSQKASAAVPAPLIVPEPTIEPPKVVAPPVPAPAPVTGPVIEQEGQLPPTAFPVEPTSPPALTMPCPEGSHEEDGNCMPDELEPTVVSDFVKEFKLPPMLKLGEPFAGYTDFDDCVAKNQDKDDPEAYCAEIKRKVEGETVKEIYDPARGYIRDARIMQSIDKVAESMNVQNQALAKLSQFVASLPKSLQQPALVESKLRARADLQNLVYMRKLGESVGKVANSIMGYQHKVAEQQTRYFAGLVRNLTECSRKSDASVATYAKQISERVFKQKGDYETILNALDDKYSEFKEHYKTLEQRVKEQEEELEKRKCPKGQHYDEEKDDCVSNEEPEEVTELRAKIEELEAEKQKSLKETESLATRMDNLEAGLKGQFKGHAKPVDTKNKASYDEGWKPPKKK